MSWNGGDEECRTIFVAFLLVSPAYSDADEMAEDSGCCDNEKCAEFYDCVADNMHEDMKGCPALPVGVILAILVVLIVVGVVSCILCCRKSSGSSVTIVTQAQPAMQPAMQQAMPAAQPAMKAAPVAAAPVAAAPVAATPAPATFNVAVPPGVQPGQQIQVQSPNTGQMLTVAVPAGYTAGMQFPVQG